LDANNYPASREDQKIHMRAMGQAQGGRAHQIAASKGKLISSLISYADCRSAANFFPKIQQRNLSGLTLLTILKHFPVKVRSCVRSGIPLILP
jgi:hypothetical protein